MINRLEMMVAVCLLAAAATAANSEHVSVVKGIVTNDGDEEQQIIWPVTAGSIPSGWYDTLVDHEHGQRIIAYVGVENPDEYFRIRVNTELGGSFTASEQNQIFIGIQPKTSGAGSSYGLPTEDTGFDFVIDWGDGTVERLTDADRTSLGRAQGFLHTYATSGIYDITMKGEIPYWRAHPDGGKWLGIFNWGTQELKGCNWLLYGTRHLQIVGDALKYPPVTPNVKRWHRPFQWNASHYHPAYDTSAAQLLDRMFYHTKLKRAPFLDTGECRNFHNFFRDASVLEGAIPHYNTSRGEFFYRFFRAAKKLRTEDIPLLDTSKGRVFEGMFADLPLVTRIPDGYDFSRAGEPLSNSIWVPYSSHQNVYASAFRLFAAGHTHVLGLHQNGWVSGLEVMSNIEINTPASMGWGFHKNSGMKHVEDFDITIGDGFRLFYESAIESVQGVIRRHPEPLLAGGSLYQAFANCTHLESADLHFPGWESMNGLFANSSIKHLVLDAPDYVSDFNLLVPDVSTLESLRLPNWSSDLNISIENSAMDRDAIMALIDSLPDRTGKTPVTMYIAGAAGADDITRDDIETAAAKNWILPNETVVVKTGPAETVAGTAITGASAALGFNVQCGR